MNLLAKSLLVTACILTLGSAQAQTIKIMKGNEVVATYNASEADTVMFEPADNEQSVSDIIGTYDVTLEVSLVEMPNMGILQTSQTVLTISPSDNDHIKIDLPECVYVMNGNQMVLPAISVDDIEVNNGSFNKEYNGVEQGTDKTYSGTVSGTVNAEGLNITETMKYGTMPFTLKMNYKSN